MYVVSYAVIVLILIILTGTGIFQPADVGIQRILKQFIRQEMLEFLVESHSAQMSSGLSAEDVKITTSYPILRSASVKPIVNLFNFLSSSMGREIIQRVRMLIFLDDLLLITVHVLSGMAKVSCQGMEPWWRLFDKLSCQASL